MNKVRETLKQIIQNYKEDPTFYGEIDDIRIDLQDYLRFHSMIQTSRLDKEEKQDLLRILGRSPKNFNERHTTVKMTFFSILEPLQNDPNQH